MTFSVVFCCISQSSGSGSSSSTSSVIGSTSTQSKSNQNRNAILVSHRQVCGVCLLCLSHV